MKPLSKFEYVDVINTLREVMLHNTRHYQSDFEYDARMLTEAARNLKNQSFLWMSRDSGTWCFPANEVYIENTPANHTWSYYSYLDHVKAFWIELVQVKDSIVKGNIVELDYQQHLEDITQNSHRPDSVQIIFNNPAHVRSFDILDYNEINKSILARYGTVERVDYMAADDLGLHYMINETMERLFQNAESNNIDAYVKEMVREYFHSYGYTKDDMAFITQVDVYDALCRGLPVFALHKDGSAERIAQNTEISVHVYEGGIFGMEHEMKNFLGYLNDNQPDKAPFTKSEADLLYQCVVFSGEGNDALTADELKRMESLMFKLDIMPQRNDQPYFQTVREQEQDERFDSENGMEV